MAEVLRAHNIYVFDLPLLVVLISLVYSATRYDHWPAILNEAFRWGLRLVGFLGLITVILYLVNSFNIVVFLILVGALVLGSVVYLAIEARTRGST
jgi:hypothetical protein